MEMKSTEVMELLIAFVPFEDDSIELPQDKSTYPSLDQSGADAAQRSPPIRPPVQAKSKARQKNHSLDGNLSPLSKTK